MILYSNQAMKNNFRQKISEQFSEKITQTLNDKLSFELPANWSQSFSEQYVLKLKEIKSWTSQNAPSVFKPALSYALDWLSPELLGSGFTLSELSENQMKAVVPYVAKNCDFEKQIHAGLVVNAGFEMIKLFVNQHWPVTAWSLESYKIEIVKKNSWTQDLNLFLKVDSVAIDQLCIQLQTQGEAEATFALEIIGGSRLDSMTYICRFKTKKLLTESVNL